MKNLARVVAFFLVGCVAAAAIEIRVEPGTEISTLIEARDAIRKLPHTNSGELTEPVRVTLATGIHRIDKPLVLTPVDSGNAAAPVVWRGESGAVISGGREIKGWKVGADGRWRTTVSSGWRFTQLFVNGEARSRPRLPKQGFYRVAGFPEGCPPKVHYHTDCKSFEFKPGDIRADWHNRADVEVIVYHYWTDSHLPIESVDETSRIVTFVHKAGKVFADGHGKEGSRYIVENVKEALGEPGEWYLDRADGELTYLPKPGETPASVTVVAPVAKALLQLAGNPTKRRLVQHVSFENLIFKHTNWQLPKGNSNDGQGSSSIPAAITLTGVRDVAFSRCRVADTGTWAFEIGEGCRRTAITACEVGPVAAGAIRVGGSDSHPLLRTGEITIENNHIHDYGTVYPSAVGVLLTHADSCRVAHNHIHDGFYTGISVGWRWGYGESPSRNNLVEYNHIHDIGKGLLSDMGAIYTLGRSPGTIIRGNRIHHVDASYYGGWGIYNDEGSSYILIENNLVHDTKYALYDIHYARDLMVRNNIFAFGEKETIKRGKVEPHRTVTLERNIVYNTLPEMYHGNWKDMEHSHYLFPQKGKHQPQRSETRTQTFLADYNCYFSPVVKPEELRFAGASFEEWRQRGQDKHSMVADPGFVDAESRDFRLKPGSPVLALGFEPFDFKKAGVQVPAGPE
ncbi:MAG: right-handed parallel beta-helix repeat-containing protein [Kiritimatiellales bacterium]|nr:right-handed parallel beta-helix repeat-containing protein [Kiritimatiellales bacterium]